MKLGSVYAASDPRPLFPLGLSVPDSGRAGVRNRAWVLEFSRTQGQSSALCLGKISSGAELRASGVSHRGSGPLELSVFLEERNSKPPWFRHREWWLEMDVATSLQSGPS